MNLNNTSSKTLWIGEIDSWMDEKFLIKVFSEYANVRNIKVIRDKITGAPQGYGFVEFDSSEVASYVLEACNGNLIPNSRKVFKLNWATLSAGKVQALLGSTLNAEEYTIYVCDLDLNVSEEMLKDVFEQIYPSVTSSKLIIDPITKLSKGYGFVKFADFNESQKAIMEMNGKFILSKPIKTNQAVWKKYNPDANKTLNNNIHKPYHNNNFYHKNKGHYNNNNNYNQQSYSYNNQFKINNHINSNVSYSQNVEDDMEEMDKTSTPMQPCTQNINIYLQSLYQQHYLNNVYMNQYLNNDAITQSFSDLKIENTSQNQFNGDYNNDNDASESINNNNSEFIGKHTIDSTINFEGK